MWINVNLEMSKEVYNRYNELAENKNVGKVFSDRLKSCVDHTAEKPIYLNDKDRQALEDVLGYNIDSPEQLIKLVKQVVTMKVGNVKVPVKADLLSRLKSRCYPVDNFPAFVQEQVQLQLEQFVGLR